MKKQISQSQDANLDGVFVNGAGQIGVTVGGVTTHFDLTYDEAMFIANALIDFVVAGATGQNISEAMAIHANAQGSA